MLKNNLDTDTGKGQRIVEGNYTPYVMHVIQVLVSQEKELQIESHGVKESDQLGFSEKQPSNSKHSITICKKKKTSDHLD